MLLLRWISSSWFEQNIENGKRYRHVQKFLYHSKRKAMSNVYHFHIRFSSLKDHVKHVCQKLEKLIFKSNMANPVNILYSELHSQQRAIYLRVSNNT